MNLTPTVIRAVRPSGLFELQWAEGPLHRVPFKFIRAHCPCAGCINEITGERTLNPETIPDLIEPTAMAPVGNYAVKITWSDGHATGLYTWEHLARIAQAHAGQI